MNLFANVWFAICPLINSPINIVCQSQIYSILLVNCLYTENVSILFVFYHFHSTLNLVIEDLQFSVQLLIKFVNYLLEKLLLMFFSIIKSIKIHMKKTN
jgi:capsular polysaccharide biosynthesis protein